MALHLRRVVGFASGGHSESFERGLKVAPIEHDRAPDAIKRNKMAMLPVAQSTTAYRQHFNRLVGSEIRGIGGGDSGFDSLCVPGGLNLACRSFCLVLVHLLTCRICKKSYPEF